MAIRLTVFVSIVFFAFSCSSSHESEALMLNNGDKWKVDENMMIFIREMESDVKAFEMSSDKDYKALAENLQKGLGKLTSNCTMKGPAHDELHKWLHPYITLTKSLGKEESENLGTYTKIKEAFTEFNKYFE